jgi:radical SAM superfamily enzyme YgiQ (UPF0313 family)
MRSAILEGVRILLVGLFRSIVPEGGDTPFGSQGGFVDTLAPDPYSLANGYLKAYAQADPTTAERYQIELLNLAEPLELEDEREQVELSETHIDQILAFDPHVVGFSGYCWNIDAIAAAATELKLRRPDLKIMVGGRATHGDPEDLLRDLPSVDILVVGEGEIPFLSLLRSDFEEPQACPGVIFRRDGTIVQGKAPVSVQDLDTIPSPHLSGVVTPARNGMMMELSRGCLHGCGYCTWNSDKQLRLFGPQRVQAEVRWARQQGHRHITINDSAINYDTEGLIRTVRAIRQGDPEGLIQFTYNVRHERLGPEQLAALSRLPTHMVLCGVETIVPGSMGLVDRDPVDVEALRSVLGQLASVTRPPVVSIVLGLPGDTQEGFRHTLETLLSWCGPSGQGPAVASAVLVSLLQVYRGSTLWHRRQALGLQFEPHGIPYLLEGGGWSQHALAASKAWLVERMAQEPNRLKAAEAIALMPARGGLDPRVAPALIDALILPWKVGMTHEGWTLGKTGVMRDTGQGALLRFDWHQGGGIRIRLTPIARGQAGRIRTRYYDLTPVALPGTPPPTEAASRLMKLVYVAIAHNEPALLAGKRAEAS